MIRKSKKHLVWIDCEMTGLSLEHDALVEVAALVTDYDLNILGDGVDVIIKPPAEALEQMNELVTKMHTDSGLLTELEAGITDPGDRPAADLPSLHDHTLRDEIRRFDDVRRPGTV